MQVAGVVAEWLSARTAKRGLVSSGDRGRALALLREPGCPICAEARAQERRFFRWFPVDYYAEGWWVRRLIESRGFCRDHFWQLIAASGIPYQFSYVAQYLLAAARDNLAGVARAAASDGSAGFRGRRLQSAISALQSGKRCPVCQDMVVWEDWAIRQLLVGLAFPEVEEALRASTGLCLPHLRRALAQCNPGEADLLLKAHQGGLTADAGASAAMRADGSLSSSLYSAAGAKEGLSEVGGPDDRARGGTGWDRVAAEITAGDDCPVCAAITSGLEDLYGRLHSVGGPEQAPVAWPAETGTLCPTHLAEVVRRAGAAALDPIRPGLTPETLAEMASQASVKAKPSLSGLVPRRGRRGASGGPPAAPSAPPCPVCSADEALMSAALDALLATLAEPGGRERYRACGGLCQVHLRVALRRVPLPIVRFLVETQLGRVSGLESELADYFRKSDYRCRDAPRGREQTAWLRAIALLVGNPVCRA